MAREHTMARRWSSEENTRDMYKILVSVTTWTTKSEKEEYYLMTFVGVCSLDVNWVDLMGPGPSSDGGIVHLDSELFKELEILKRNEYTKYFF
jgi:hypothetical protein